MSWDRNSAHYPPAVRQFDSTACWAAGLEWWLRCMRESRAVITQLNLVSKFVGLWNSDEDSPEYGTVTGESLGQIMADSAINMDYSVIGAGTWDSSFIEGKLGISPVLLGYHEPEVGGFHVNIIHSLNRTTTADVNVMDPNGGRFRTRSHGFLNTRNYVLGWAK